LSRSHLRLIIKPTATAWPGLDNYSAAVAKLTIANS